MEDSSNQLKNTLYDSCKVLAEFFVGYDMEFVVLTNAIFRLMNDESGQDELANHVKNQLIFLRSNLWEANRRLVELAQKMEISLPAMRIPSVPSDRTVKVLTVALDQLSCGFEQFRMNLELCQRIMKGQTR